MIRAGIIGFAHMHVNEIALYISEHPDFELVAAADAKSGVEEIPPFRYTPAWNRDNIRENYCKNIYSDYREMLEKESLEIVFILTENSLKRCVFEDCAKKKINIVVEKPMAVSYKEAVEMGKIAEKYGIEAYVNWPVAWREYLHKFKFALDNKIVGEPEKLRYINGHTGPLGKGAQHRGVSAKAEEMNDEMRGKTWWHQQKYGGGVYLDIGCYGCFFTAWLLGRGKSVFACGNNLNTHFGDTDDNFAATVRFNENKLSLIEGTWTTPRVVIPSGPSLLCSNGIIKCIGGAENAPDVVAYDIYGKEVEIPEYSFPEYLKNMPTYYAAKKKGECGEFDMVSLKKNIEIMGMLDALQKSAKEKKEEKISG